MSKQSLIYWWKRGWMDERYGSSSVESDNALENKAYQLGAKVCAERRNPHITLAEYNYEYILKSIKEL